ncbi:MAG: hypothetical protein R6X02_03040 [Enhygromyxa sp.]
MSSGPLTTTTARRHPAAVVALVAAALGCTEPAVIGEGQFSRPIAIASDPAAPLPRLAWRPGAACPGPVGGCESFCEGPPESCPEDACLPLLIDSGTPLSILPGERGAMSFGKECVEVRAAGDLLNAPDDPAVLAGSTASFRFRDAPMIRASGDEVEGWEWEAGDERNPIGIGGVIGGNILRDFAMELRHLEGEPPTLAVYSNYPGNEAVLGDQGRAYIRLAYPGRLLGRLLNDRCELGPSLDCQLSFNLDQNNQEQLFNNTRALVDACVAPPPCVVDWISDDDQCLLRNGATDMSVDRRCDSALGHGATLLVATGVPGLVLFDDSAIHLLGPLDALPSCDDPFDIEARACREADPGRLVLPGWAPLEQLTRLRVRALGLVEGLSQPAGNNPCVRLRDRLEGLVRQCEGYVAEGRPVRPRPLPGQSIGSSALVLGQVALGDDPSVATWIETLIVPASAAPVMALRREVVPEGAQPDGMIGGALLRNTSTVLDFTESVESPGVRVRCLDPGKQCLPLPACTADVGGVEFESADAGRTSCCFGLPPALIGEVVRGGEGKHPPRIEDACCSALPRADLIALQGLGLCSDVDLL